MAMNRSRNSFIKSSVDLMDLAAVGTVVGLVVTAVVVQFIFTTATFSLERRPRMAGPGVSVMYQYEFTQWG